MGLIKISELPLIQVSEIDDDDFVPVVDVPPLGTSRTKRMRVSDLFQKAPVTSVAGKSGAITLSSSDLTDADSLGGVDSVNGKTGTQITIDTNDLASIGNYLAKTELGDITNDFQGEYATQTSGELTTEYAKLARFLGNDIGNLRVSLFSVQQTAGGALQASTASDTYATKASLGNYLTATDIADGYYNKSSADGKFLTSSDVSSFLSSSQIADTYTSQVSLANALDGFSSDTFDGTSIDAVTGKFSAKLSADSLSIQNNAGILGTLSSLRADVGDSSSPSTDVGNDSSLVVHGNAKVNGTISANNLEVLGGVSVKNTQVVQISDDFIEINKTDTTPTGTASGIRVYVGASLDQPEISWDNQVSIWQTKIGSSLASLRANTIEYANTYAETSLPTANSHQGMFAWDSTNSQAKVSTGIEWKTLVLSEDFGTLEEFETAFNTALGL